MKNVIIGTAGHVDHGKTRLIQALTGINTDRLEEEKKRGITIELGFAYMEADDHTKIGIIDVPGHEKFIKNMLAGIGGIDLVLLIIALDEGVMPQTVEHFEILKSLHIPKGILVFSKADLVDDEWAVMVEEDAFSLIRGSFLENAPHIRVSAETNENIDELKQMILKELSGIREKRISREMFRLPMDRVFTMEGFGTVVTGTLVEGSCHVGDEVMLYPFEKKVKIRGIQNHGQAVEAAFAGQRIAINLANISKENLVRGEILAACDSMIVSQRIDAAIELFGSTARKLKNGDRVHISYGSAQAVCKVILLNENEIEKGKQVFAQLQFLNPIAVKRGDRFIIRFYSPVETFGGGIVLDSDAVKHKRFNEDLIDNLKLRQNGGNDLAAEAEIRSRSYTFPDVEELRVRLNLTEDEMISVLIRLKKQKKIIAIGGRSYMHETCWEQVKEEAQKLMKDYYLKNVHSSGIQKEEFANRLKRTLHLYGYKSDDLVLELVKRGILSLEGTKLVIERFRQEYSASQNSMRKEIYDLYMKAGYEVPAADEVLKSIKDKKQGRQIISDLLEKKELINLGSGYFITAFFWKQALQILKDHFSGTDGFTLGEYRDGLGTSRKYAMIILEAMDQAKITKKHGDIRIVSYYPEEQDGRSRENDGLS